MIAVAAERAPRQLRILSHTRTGLRVGEIGVDLFAGCGGWSEGFQRSTGVPPAVAVNHNAHAIHLHTLNHPETEHHQEDVFAVSPQVAVKGRRVGWLHASPDCTHFSRAKGGKPRNKNIRALAWVVRDWAREVRPRIISLENVAEFVTWGPLGEDGQPNKARAGETFAEFTAALRELGYAVEWRNLKACDFGAPTSRTRLFLIARCDGEPIRWPVPTHGPGRKSYRTAAECIDWSIPCPSIFERKKALVEATQRRIAEGIRRYVVEAQKPFLLTLTHGGRLVSIDAPMPTVTAAHRGETALVTPFLAGIDNQSNANGAWPAEAPLGTITTENRFALAAAFMVQAGYGERTGQAPRTLNIREPLGTVVAGGLKHTLVAAFLTKFYGSESGQNQDAREPIHTIPTLDRFGLVTVTVAGQPYVVADIGMRMLQPRELARAQGFPDSYILDGSKSDQVARIGNSVCPDVAAAIVKANIMEPNT